MKSIELIFKIFKINIKQTFEEIHIIAIQYAMSIILHKRRIETTNRYQQIRNQHKTPNTHQPITN